MTTLLLTTLMVGVSYAQDQNSGAIKGKWGVGAGLGNNSTEITLIRGHSDRTAWLLNTQFDYRRSALDEAVGFTSGDGSSTVVAIGPGIRRFLAPSSVLSPYVDLSASYLYRRDVASLDGSTPQTQERTLNGAAVAFAGGAEYFTPWRFSVAIHSEFASFSWLQERTQATTSGVSSSERTRISSVTAGLSPILFARVYF